MLELFTLMLLPLLGALNSQNFPEVLSSEEEAKYLAAWQKKDYLAREKLIEHNLRLVAHIVKRYDHNGFEKDDLLSIGTFGLIKAIDTFNFEAQNKLATYAAKCIENEILMYIRSQKKRKETISLYSPLGEDKEGNEIILYDIIEDPSPSVSTILINEERKQQIHQALKNLNKREYEIICRRFGLDGYHLETQREIAKSMNISRSYVSRIEKRVLTKLYLQLKNKI